MLKLVKQTKSIFINWAQILRSIFLFFFVYQIEANSFVNLVEFFAKQRSQETVCSRCFLICLHITRNLDMHQAWQEWRYESFFFPFPTQKTFQLFSWKMQSMLYLFNQNWNRNKRQTKCTFTYFCSYCALPKVLSKLSLEVFKTSKSKVGKSYCPPNRSKLSLTKCETCQWKIWKLTNRWSKIVKADLDHWHQIEGNW